MARATTPDAQRRATTRARTDGAAADLSPVVESTAGRAAAASGRASRAACSGSTQPAADRPDPIAILEAQGATRVAGAAADPLRAHGRLAVHLLPRRGRGHGRRPRRRAPDQAPRPAVRRRAPVQLRDLPLARALARVRPQRLRRDAPGAVRVGHEAARRELHRRRPVARLAAVPQRTARCSTPWARTGSGWASTPGPGRSRRGTRGSRSTTWSRSCPARPPASSGSGGSPSSATTSARSTS